MHEQHELDIVIEHSARLGNIDGRVVNLEVRAEKIDVMLSETAELTRATAQSVKALTKFGYILASVAVSAMVTAIANLILRLV
jgi:hypothetical protein